MIGALRERLRRHRRLIQVVISAALLGLLLWRARGDEMVSRLREAPLLLLIPWTLAYDLATTFLWGNGIYALFRRLNKAGGYRRVIGGAYKLQVLSVAVPGRLGDAGSFIFWKGLYSPASILAVMLVDKALTLPLTVLLAAGGLGLFLSSWSAAMALLASLAGAAFLAAFLIGSAGEGIRRRSRELILGRRAASLAGFREELVRTLADRRGVLTNLLITVSRLALAGVSYSLILSWFGASVPLWKVMLVQAVAQLAAAVPLSFLGLGVNEAVIIALLSRSGVAAETVLAASLAGTAAHLLFVLLAFLAWRLPATLSECRRPGTKLAPADADIRGGEARRPVDIEAVS